MFHLSEPPRPQRRRQIAELDQQRRKLFELYYGDHISADSFHAEDLRLNAKLEAFQGQCEPEPSNESTDAFEHVVAVLADLDWEVIWDAATDQERRPCSMSSSSTSTCFPTISKSKSEVPEN